MGLQLAIQYNNQPLTYDVTPQESEVCILKLASAYSGVATTNGDFVPMKVVIRRKGKIWVSDQESCQEIAQALMDEINKIY
jgi:hypothetical protein